MPNWLPPLVALIVLVGFIVFAFRQGLKVKPDNDNRDNWANYGGPPDRHGGPPDSHGGSGN
jgi:hypothetical protein